MKLRPCTFVQLAILACAALAALLAPASAEASRHLSDAIDPVTTPSASLEDLAAAAEQPSFPVLTTADRVDLADLATGARLEAQRLRLLGVPPAVGYDAAASPTTRSCDWRSATENRPILAYDDWQGQPSARMRLFQGLWTDPVTGLAYARARWYDARNASWLSEDPLLDVDSPNLYAGFRLNPSFYTDPYGECINPADPECRAKWKAGALSAAKKVAEYVPPFVSGLWEEPQDIGEGLGVAIRETVKDPSFPAQVLQAQVRDAVATTVDIAMEDPEALLADASNETLDILADPNRAGRTSFQLGLVFGTGLLGREASVVSRSARAATDLVDDISDAAVSSRGVATGEPIMQIGMRHELASRAYANGLGEMVIESEYLVGAAPRGFDFLSFSGSGADARLIVNESKDVKRCVSPGKLTTFGLGRSGAETYQAALRQAEQAVRTAGLDVATEEALLAQLQQRAFTLRIVGSAQKGTRVSQGTLDLLRKSTGVSQIETVNLP